MRQASVLSGLPLTKGNETHREEGKEGSVVP